MGSLISHETIIDNNTDSSMETSFKSHVYILKGRGLDKGMLRGKGSGDKTNDQRDDNEDYEQESGSKGRGSHKN